MLIEQIVTAGKSILAREYLGLSTMISMDESEYVFHEAYEWTKIMTLATAMNAAQINL